ncbi:MAG TPA: hypothetical protein DEP72_03300 [Clostridiales bacterium]|nr:MAG: hypothetical protein A2Y18_07430 [Clostridiales bacterium GWD2_32_19]HCC07179.1 hypothetical protein [Clostridiales bacterium]
MKHSKENTMEIFLMLAALILIFILFVKRTSISFDTYIQTMAQVSIISIFLAPQFIKNARKKVNDKVKTDDGE